MVLGCILTPEIVPVTCDIHVITALCCVEQIPAERLEWNPFRNSCNTMNVRNIPSTSTPSHHLKTAMILLLLSALVHSKTGIWGSVSELCTNPLY
jgi:hypothetical protein